MKRGHSLALGLLALALAACGGSGNDSNSNSEPVGLTNTPRIEAVLYNPALDPNYIYQDPLNLQTGDVVRFELVNYTTSGDSTSRNVLDVDSFRTNDTNSVAGSLDTDGGVFSSASSDTGSRQYILTARYQGVDYSTFYKINPRQIRLRGRLLAEGSNKPVYNATIDFYSNRNPLDPTSAQIVIATVHTGPDGTFRASIPAFNDNVSTVAEANDAPKVTFTVRSSALPDGYYNSFVFKGFRYDAGSNVCRAALVSNDVVTDPDTGETAFLPYKSGDRLLISEDEDNSLNGTILLTPTSLFNTKPDPDGCSAN